MFGFGVARLYAVMVGVVEVKLGVGVVMEEYFCPIWLVLLKSRFRVRYGIYMRAIIKFSPSGTN